MNKYEKAIAELTDETLNRVVKDSWEAKEHYAFQIQVNEISGVKDTNRDKMMYALMEILSNFANRELKERGKKKK